VQILKGHLSTKPVRSLAFSPDGTKLASSARDYKTFLWDLATGRHEEIERSGSFTVAFSPDGKVVATGRRWNATLWDTTTRQARELPIRYSHGVDGWGPCWDLAYTPDGKRLAAVSGVVRLYDAATLEEIPLPQDKARLATNCLAFTRDGSTLATGHGLAGSGMVKKLVRLWDARTWQVEKELTGSTAVIDAVSFSPDGRFLAAAAGTTLFVWEVASGGVVVQHVIGKQHFQDVAFSPDGRLLAFARNDASIRFWDTGSWSEVAAYDWEVGPMICLAFAPDGMRAAGGSGKGKIVVFDVDL
jgi:dipeptidyl aminopeptidase/acylaminoacyl peptidase